MMFFEIPLFVAWLLTPGADTDNALVRIIGGAADVFLTLGVPLMLFRLLINLLNAVAKRLPPD